MRLNIAWSLVQTQQGATKSKLLIQLMKTTLILILKLLHESFKTPIELTLKKIPTDNPRSQTMHQLHSWFSWVKKSFKK